MKTISFKLTDREAQRLARQIQDDGFGRDRSKWLNWVTRNSVLSPTDAMLVQRGTRSNLAPLWMRNYGENLFDIRSSPYNLKTLYRSEPTPRRCVVIGRGPSMFIEDHLSLIYESNAYQDDELTVFACDGAFKECLRHGIIPDYVTAIDGSPVCVKWFDDIDPVKVAKTKVFVGGTVHPETVTEIRRTLMPIYWFMPSFDDVNALSSLTAYLGMQSITEKNPSGLLALPTGGNVGTLSWIMSWELLKHSDVCLVGLDCGYPKGMPADETYYWNPTLQGLEALQLSTHYEDFYNPFTKDWYYTDLVFSMYRHSFLDYVERKPSWLKISNASSGTLYYPPFIQPVELEEWLTDA